MSTTDERLRVLVEDTVLIGLAAAGSAAGAASADHYEFVFSTTGMVPPGKGQLRLDNADQTLATRLWLSTETASAVDVKRLLMLTQQGNRVDLQDKDDSGRYQQYRLTSPPVDYGSYVEYPVAHETGGQPVAGQRVLVTVIRTTA